MKMKRYTYKFQTNTTIEENTLKSQITKRVSVMLKTKVLLDMKNWEKPIFENWEINQTMVSQHHPGNIYNDFLPKKLFWGYSCKYPVLNVHLMVIFCQFNVFFYYFLSIVHYKPQGIGCNDGPQVYHEWLGIEIVDPWIMVKRCINCKPSEVKKITKHKLRRDTGYTTYIVDEHVKCK